MKYNNKSLKFYFEFGMERKNVRLNKTYELLKQCTICPRNCHADRTIGNSGFCHSGVLPKAALASIHKWEEPCISGIRGSGTVFFSGCNLHCIFCQNYAVSNENFGKEITIERLADILIEQQNRNVHNINLVTPSHFLPQIRDAILLAKKRGLSIPIVYNTNGYEKVESLKLLEGLIDVYLPDIKYYDEKFALEFSNAPNYFETASDAVLEMYRQVGKNCFSANGLLEKGVLIRHLILPGCKEDSKKILDWIKKNFGNTVFVSLMNQYTPMYKALTNKQLSRRLTTFEYQKVVDYFLEIGLENGYIQKKSSAKSSYTPLFDLKGI